jgi:hypothetical protein
MTQYANYFKKQSHTTLLLYGFVLILSDSKSFSVPSGIAYAA